ncbi:MAG TPA: hypothetical protein VN028_07660 [Rhodocyclaceae bacterium]|nr:hypothetical protein [Rhodocyclaceae bacterium]
MTNLNQTLNQAKEETGAALKEASNTVKDGVASTRKIAQEKLGEMESQVIKHPNKALGIALLAGVALGCMLSSRRHH